jgi:hypothetical protein
MQLEKGSDNSIITIRDVEIFVYPTLCRAIAHVTFCSSNPWIINNNINQWFLSCGPRPSGGPWHSRRWFAWFRPGHITWKSIRKRVDKGVSIFFLMPFRNPQSVFHKILRAADINYTNMAIYIYIYIVNTHSETVIKQLLI